MLTGIVCPVCGFNDLPREPYSYLICCCCGTEFELDDEETPHEELRRRWIEGGCVFWSKRRGTPTELWNPFAQLEKAFASS